MYNFANSTSEIECLRRACSGLFFLPLSQFILVSFVYLFFFLCVHEPKEPFYTQTPFSALPLFSNPPPPRIFIHNPILFLFCFFSFPTFTHDTVQIQNEQNEHFLCVLKMVCAEFVRDCGVYAFEKNKALELKQQNRRRKITVCQCLVVLCSTAGLCQLFLDWSTLPGISSLCDARWCCFWATFIIIFTMSLFRQCASLIVFWQRYFLVAGCFVVPFCFVSIGILTFFFVCVCAPAAQNRFQTRFKQLQTPFTHTLWTTKS